MGASPGCDSAGEVLLLSSEMARPSVNCMVRTLNFL